MKSVDSILVAIDGESKSGKTTWMDAIAEEARYQAGFYESAVAPDSSLPIDEKTRAELHEWVDSIALNGIHRITAGNAFRAAAYYVIEKEKVGVSKSGFDESDTSMLRELLAEEGVQDFLQSDSAVERRVSTVAQMVGVRALCETIFCDEVVNAYHLDGGSNLVIVDARNPVDILERNNVVGQQLPNILAGSILPLFIDTPVEIAAARKSGDYNDNLADITKRRQLDATRSEYPFVRPTPLTCKLGPWLQQFPRPETASGIATSFLITNDESLPLDGVQYIAGCIASAAHDMSAYLNASRQPGYETPKLDAAPEQILSSN